MEHPVRSLAPAVAVALVLAGALIAWIRLEPVAVPRTTQVVVCLALVAAIAVLLVLVRRADDEYDSSPR